VEATYVEGMDLLILSMITNLFHELCRPRSIGFNFRMDLYAIGYES
jgi:hypothetical protein